MLTSNQALFDESAIDNTFDCPDPIWQEKGIQPQPLKVQYGGDRLRLEIAPGITVSSRSKTPDELRHYTQYYLGVDVEHVNIQTSIKP